MSNSPTKTDTRTECLIHGYVKCLQITDQITPISIIEMIIKFYYKDTIIIYFHSNGRNQKPDICYHNIEFNTKHQFDIQIINDKLKQKHFTTDVNSGICFVKDIHFPKNIIKLNDIDKLNENKLYDIVFTMDTSRNCSAYIIDSNNNKFKCAYYYKLPSLSTLGYSGDQYLLYSNKHGLISFDKTCSFLKFTEIDDSDSDLKWVDADFKWNESRGALSSVFISSNKLLICGGRGEYKTYVDMYDFNNKQLIKLSNMNKHRLYSGICFDKFSNNRVFNGAGYRSSRTVEYFEINKNKWILLPSTNEQHDAWPLVYISEQNIVHIASPQITFERIDIRENKWIKYIPNRYKTFDQLFGIKTHFPSSRLFYASTV